MPTNRVPHDRLYHDTDKFVLEPKLPTYLDIMPASGPCRGNHLRLKRAVFDKILRLCGFDDTAHDWREVWNVETTARLGRELRNIEPEAVPADTVNRLLELVRLCCGLCIRAVR